MNQSSIDYCANAAIFRESILFHTIQLAKSLACVAAIIILTYLLLKRRYLVYRDTEAPILVLMYILLMVYAIDVVVIVWFHFFDNLLHSDPCDLVHSSFFCIWFQVPHVYCLNGFVLTMGALGVDRFTSTLSGNCQGEKRRSYLLCGIVLVLSAVPTWLVWHTVTFDTSNLHCLQFPISIMERASAVMYFFLAMDAVVMVLYLSLYYVNVRLIKNSPTLDRSCILRENLSVLGTFFPLVFFHCFVFCFYTLTGNFIRKHHGEMGILWYRTATAVTNIIPYYCLFFPLLMLLISKGVRKNRERQVRRMITPLHKGRPIDEREIYFRSYSNMWNKK